MGRIRTIKPEFWTDEDLAELPEATHMLAAALLNYADDEGYFNANPALVQASCCPLREPSVSIQDSLQALAGMGYLSLGNGPNGKRYGRINNFDEHQRVNRPTPSKIKELDVVWEDSLNPHGGLTEDSLLEGKGKEGKGTGKGSTPAPKERKPKAVEQTFDQWFVSVADAMPADDPLFAWSSKAGIPAEWIGYAWSAFADRYSGRPKTYADWRAAFRDHVKRGWLDIWRAERGGGLVLTTVGEQWRRAS